MNSLSWMLYLADVTGSFSTVLSFSAIGGGLGGLVAVIAAAISTDLDNIGKAEKRPIFKTGWKAGGGFFKFAIAVALVASVIPSKTTIYAIAASEVGEDLAKTETATKAVKALDAWLDRQIAEKPE